MNLSKWIASSLTGSALEAFGPDIKKFVAEIEPMLVEYERGRQMDVSLRCREIAIAEETLRVMGGDDAVERMKARYRRLLDQVEGRSVTMIETAAGSIAKVNPAPVAAPTFAPASSVVGA